MPRRNRASKKGAAPVFQTLEQRQLLSVSLNNGLLDIVGSNKADTVVVSWADASKNVLSVKLNGQVSLISDPVKQIRIETARGNDSITILEAGTPISAPATVYAGRGDDAVITGSANDTIYGGSGINQIDAGAGKNKVYGAFQAAQPALSSTAYQPAVSNPIYQPMVTVPSFVVTDLGTLPNKAGDSWVRNIGGVAGATPYEVGYAWVNDASRQRVRHGFRRGTGGMVDIGTVGGGGAFSEAWDVTFDGHVVGTSTQGTGTGYRAVYFDGTRLVDLGGTSDTIAYGINHQYTAGGAEVVVGTTGAPTTGLVPDESRHNGIAFFWQPGRGMQMMPDGGAVGSGSVLRGEAREVNNAHTAVGWNARTNWAFALDDFDTANPTYHDLGSLHGGTSEAFDINDNVLPIAVGTSDIGATNQQAFYWNGLLMQPLPQPTTSGTVTWAWGVNNAAGGNMIVGYTETRAGASATRQAALWVPATGGGYQFINLQALTAGATGRTLTEARAISDDGSVVAIGRVQGDANMHAFLLRQGPAGGVQMAPLKFSSTFTAGLPNGGAIGGLSYNIYGVGDFTVGKRTVTMNMISTDLERLRLPSAGTVDFTFNGPLQRWVSSTLDGTAIFAGRARAQVTTNDGQFADLLVSVEGRSFRSHKKDFIEGNFVAISSRGKVLMQGRNPVFKGSFGPS